MELILGAIVSVIAQIVKKPLGTDGWKTIGLVVALSLAAAGFYHVFTYLGYWEIVVSILTSAGAFYAFIISRFPSVENMEEKTAEEE